MPRPAAGGLPSFTLCMLGSTGKAGTAGRHPSPGCSGLMVRVSENLASNPGQDDIPDIFHSLGGKQCGLGLCACILLLLQHGHRL